MLTLGIRCTSIILRHIPSWFEAVLAIAILQSCAQRGPKWPFWGQKWPNMASLPMSQSGLRGPKMIPDDQYNMFLTIWGHFGTIWTLFDHFTQNLIFCLENTKCFLAKVIRSKKSWHRALEGGQFRFWSNLKVLFCVHLWHILVIWDISSHI